jgi:hypothetical protein
MWRCAEGLEPKLGCSRRKALPLSDSQNANLTESKLT